jgi:hypothetical protein
LAVLIIAAFACLGLFGCSKPAPVAEQELQYDQAKKTFTVGLNFDEIRQKYGSPTNEISDKEYVYWSYVPLRTPGAHVEGFEIWFKDSKSDSMHKITMDRH